MTKDRNSRIRMNSTMCIHAVNKIDVQDIKVCTAGQTWTRTICIETDKGYLEITCFSDIEDTLKIKTVVKTEVHDVTTKEVRV